MHKKFLKRGAACVLGLALLLTSVVVPKTSVKADDEADTAVTKTFTYTMDKLKDAQTDAWGDLAPVYEGTTVKINFEKKWAQQIFWSVPKAVIYSGNIVGCEFKFKEGGNTDPLSIKLTDSAKNAILVGYNPWCNNKISAPDNFDSYPVKDENGEVLKDDEGKEIKEKYTEADLSKIVSVGIMLNGDATEVELESITFTTKAYTKEVSADDLGILTDEGVTQDDNNGLKFTYPAVADFTQAKHAYFKVPQEVVDAGIKKVSVAFEEDVAASSVVIKAVDETQKENILLGIQSLETNDSWSSKPVSDIAYVAVAAADITFTVKSFTFTTINEVQEKSTAGQTPEEAFVIEASGDGPSFINVPAAHYFTYTAKEDGFLTMIINGATAAYTYRVGRKDEVQVDKDFDKANYVAIYVQKGHSVMVEVAPAVLGGRTETPFELSINFTVDAVNEKGEITYNAQALNYSQLSEMADDASIEMDDAKGVIVSFTKQYQKAAFEFPAVVRALGWKKVEVALAEGAADFALKVADNAGENGSMRGVAVAWGNTTLDKASADIKTYDKPDPTEADLDGVYLVVLQNQRGGEKEVEGEKVQVDPKNSITWKTTTFTVDVPAEDGMAWDATLDEIETADNKTPVKIDGKEDSKLPVSVLEALKDKDVNVEIAVADGIKWTINGKDVTKADAAVDLKVTVDGKTAIPEADLKNLVGKNTSKNISLAHDGEFGFKAVLTVNMDAKNKDKFANLFYYNAKDKKYEHVDTKKIAADGDVSFAFTHASDYTVVVTDEEMLTVPQTGDVNVGVFAAFAFFGFMMMAAGVVALKKRDRI